MASIALRTRALIAALFLIPVRPALAQKNFDTPPQMDDDPPAATTEHRSNRFMLRNDSRQTIDNLNISPVQASEWGDDLLGVLALPAHNRIIAGPAQDSGCVFDVRVVYHDHSEEILRRQNLCDLDSISFTGRHAHQPQTDSDNHG